MNIDFRLVLGMPRHGWLPVDLFGSGFHMACAASDVLNDPVGELFDVITNIQANGKIPRVTCWLEPGAYLIDFENKGSALGITISEADDLHDDASSLRILHQFSISKVAFVEMLRTELLKFYATDHEETHWPYRPDKTRVAKLKNGVG